MADWRGLMKHRCVLGPFSAHASSITFPQTPAPPHACQRCHSMDSWDQTYGTYALGKDKGTFNDDFHTFGFYWDENEMVSGRDRF